MAKPLRCKVLFEKYISSRNLHSSLIISGNKKWIISSTSEGKNQILSGKPINTSLIGNSNDQNQKSQSYLHLI
jgi:hypothetical protein